MARHTSTTSARGSAPVPEGRWVRCPVDVQSRKQVGRFGRKQFPGCLPSRAAASGRIEYAWVLSWSFDRKLIETMREHYIGRIDARPSHRTAPISILALDSFGAFQSSWATEFRVHMAHPVFNR